MTHKWLSSGFILSLSRVDDTVNRLRKKIFSDKNRGGHKDKLECCSKRMDREYVPCIVDDGACIILLYKIRKHTKPPR